MNSVLLIFSLALAGPGSEPDLPEIASILDSLYEPIGDVSFEFEGTFYYPDPNDPKGSSSSPSAKASNRFTGSFSYRKDGATKQETFEHQYPDQGNGQPVVVEKKKATLKGKTTQYSRSGGGSGAKTEEEGVSDYFELGSAGRVFLVRYLKAFCATRKNA